MSIDRHDKIQEFLEIQHQIMYVILKEVPDKKQIEEPLAYLVLYLVRGRISSLICFVLRLNIHLLKTYPYHTWCFNTLYILSFNPHPI